MRKRERGRRIAIVFRVGVHAVQMDRVMIALRNTERVQHERVPFVAIERGRGERGIGAQSRGHSKNSDHDPVPERIRPDIAPENDVVRFAHLRRSAGGQRPKDARNDEKTPHCTSIIVNMPLGCVPPAVIATRL